MLIVQYALEILSPSLKLVGLGVMIWLYIKNRKQPFLWLVVAEIVNVLRSHGFHAKEIARLGKPDGGTVVDSDQVVLGVPCNEAIEAKAVLSS